MSARVFGAIKDSTTGNFVAKASVSAAPYIISRVFGVYYFLTPGAATVDVTASAPNYKLQTKTITVVNGQQKQVDFQLVRI